jgi:nicotinate-nucleotide pyrophosphorylase (carboxylating)
LIILILKILKAVALIGDKCLTESSGNINENTIRHYAECGVDYISSEL